MFMVEVKTLKCKIFREKQEHSNMEGKELACLAAANVIMQEEKVLQMRKNEKNRYERGNMTWGELISE